MGEGGMRRGGDGHDWGWQSGRGEDVWERPLITMMLEHREEIGLSPSQTASLEHMRTEFLREVVRRQADQRLARLDLAELLRPDPSAPSKPVDIGKVEAKIRDIAGSRADLAINRIRTIEQAKSLLTGEQRSKLDALLTAPSLHRGGPAGPMRPMAPPSGRQ
jgi:Spy/CpxP family protein refolding chaperone